MSLKFPGVGKARSLKGDGASAILAGISWPTGDIGSDGDYYWLNSNAAWIMIGPKTAGAWPANTGRFNLSAHNVALRGPSGSLVTYLAGPANQVQIGMVAPPSLYLSSGNDAQLPTWGTVSNLTHSGAKYNKAGAAAPGFFAQAVDTNGGGAGDTEYPLAIAKAVVTDLPTTANKYVGVGFGSTGGNAGYFVGTESTGKLTIFRLGFTTTPIIVAALAAGTVVAGDTIVLVKNGKLLTAISSAGTTIRASLQALSAYNVDSIYGKGGCAWWQDGDTAGKMNAVECAV
jgi:hypothetical protein